MAEVINLTVNAKIKNGPTVAFAQSFDIDAYDKLATTLTQGIPKTIQLIPSGSDSVYFLMIKSSHYSDQVSYTVNDAATDIVLDSPQSFSGAGSLKALDSGSDPSTLVFTSELAEDVSIQILVGRNATSTP